MELRMRQKIAKYLGFFVLFCSHFFIFFYFEINLDFQKSYKTGIIIAYSSLSFL